MDFLQAISGLLSDLLGVLVPNRRISEFAPSVCNPMRADAHFWPSHKTRRHTTGRYVLLACIELRRSRCKTVATHKVSPLVLLPGR